MMGLLAAALAWAGFMVVIAMFQALGLAVLEPLMGARASHILVTVPACLALMAMITAFVRGWGRPGLVRLFLLGLGWALASLGFELAMGHLVLGKSMEAILAGYNVARGQMWPLAQLTMLLWPMAAGRLRPRRRRAATLN